MQASSTCVGVGGFWSKVRWGRRILEYRALGAADFETCSTLFSFLQLYPQPYSALFSCISRLLPPSPGIAAYSYLRSESCVPGRYLLSESCVPGRYLRSKSCSGKSRTLFRSLVLALCSGKSRALFRHFMLAFEDQHTLTDVSTLFQLYAMLSSRPAFSNKTENALFRFVFLRYVFLCNTVSSDGKSEYFLVFPRMFWYLLVFFSIF